MIKKLITSLLIVISVLTITPISASAQWKKDSNNSWSWSEKGTKALGWKEIDGEWYNFGNNGIMKTGWIGDNGTWYYCWSNGTMAHNSWLTNGGFWYYFDENGKMTTDKAVVGSNTYYFNAPAMITSKELTDLPTSNVSPSNN